MQNNKAIKFPFVFNHIDFSKDIYSVAVMNKKKKLLDMLEKQEFIDQNFNITDFDRDNHEIKSKIESLLPKYEEYTRDCLQNEQRYFSNLKVSKFLR